jgi:hypothetical protein
MTQLHISVSLSLSVLLVVAFYALSWFGRSAMIFFPISWSQVCLSI